MPKFRKEKEDKILDMIGQGYTNVEIAKKLGVHRSTVAKRRKEHEKRESAEMKSGIEELLLEGWKPRIKEKKNRRYITIRKGNKERSLGSYTDELWEKVKPIDPWATPAQLLELEKRISVLEHHSHVSQDLILKQDKYLGWKLEAHGNHTNLEKILDSLGPRARSYLERRLDFRTWIGAHR